MARFVAGWSGPSAACRNRFIFHCAAANVPPRSLSLDRDVRVVRHDEQGYIGTLVVDVDRLNRFPVETIGELGGGRVERECPAGPASLQRALFVALVREEVFERRQQERSETALGLIHRDEEIPAQEVGKNAPA
jgi:hypothetical protein